MPFAYYRRLSQPRQAIYRQSDRIATVPLPEAVALRPTVVRLSAVLENEDRQGVQEICQSIADGICQQLRAPVVQIIVLAARPSDSYGELHGLYEPAEAPYRSRITLWMRTSHRQQVVAFKTFLRTLLHELLHHLDYETLELAESFHTRGFYKRESSLFHQLVDRVDLS